MNDRPSELPAVCTLTPADLSARRGRLVPGLAAVMEAEHACCPFLRFSLSIEPGDASVTLDVSGPPGTTAFLEDLPA